MKKFLVILVSITAFIIGWAVVAAIFSTVNSKSSDQAVYNDTKNGFISGCAKKSDRNTCTCAWNALDSYYKNTGNTHWYSDSTLLNRIVSEGYNQSETDAIVSCVQ
jgi:hypothetical protein